MAFKDWSTGKKVGVIGGSIFGVFLIGYIISKMTATTTPAITTTSAGATTPNTKPLTQVTPNVINCQAITNALTKNPTAAPTGVGVNSGIF